MHLIKLNAISSTNDFLKQLAVANSVDNYTVVWADVQTQGKGQMGTLWVTEGAKNLTFSVLLNDKRIIIEKIFSLNVLITNAVLKAVKSYNLTNVWVKWPNDILSYNKKIAGILIENSIKFDGSVQAVVGIGVNLNQTDFSSYTQGSSILTQYNVSINKEELLRKIVLNIEQAMTIFDEELEWQYFHNNLFRKDLVSIFEDTQGALFLGIIKEVNHHGQLVVQLANDDLKCFNLKEIKLLY